MISFLFTDCLLQPRYSLKASSLNANIDNTNPTLWFHIVCGNGAKTL